MTRVKTIDFLKDMSAYYAQMENNWQSYNLTIEKNKDLMKSSNYKWQ
jgi:hypothetical protein